LQTQLDAMGGGTTTGPLLTSQLSSTFNSGIIREGNDITTGLQTQSNQGHLFYKLLDCRKSNRKVVQLREGIPDETFVEQIVMKLNLNGYHGVKVDMG